MFLTGREMAILTDCVMLEMMNLKLEGITNSTKYHQLTKILSKLRSADTRDRDRGGVSGPQTKRSRCRKNESDVSNGLHDKRNCRRVWGIGPLGVKKVSGT